MTRIFVYSTLSNDQIYTSYDPAVDKGALPRISHQVTIQGGANVADPKRGTVLHGKVTEINERDYEHLQENAVFKKHKEGGYIHVRTENVDAEVVAKQSMTDRDQSAPYHSKSTEFTDDKVGKPLEEKPSLGDRVKGMIGIRDDNNSGISV